MRETGSPRRIGRSILAVLAGIVVGAALSLGTDALLKAFGVFPKLGNQMSEPLFLLATAYRIVYGILGSYVIARLAPDRPMQHALIGGVLGLVGRDLLPNDDDSVAVQFDTFRDLKHAYGFQVNG